jgi:hypothetical protein
MVSILEGIVDKEVEFGELYVMRPLFFPIKGSLWILLSIKCRNTGKLPHNTNIPKSERFLPYPHSGFLPLCFRHSYQQIRQDLHLLQ